MIEYPFTTFRHIRCQKTGAVVTAAVEVNEDYINTSFSFCAPSDQFCRATGRTIALDRMLNDSHQVVPQVVPIARPDNFPSITDCVFRALEKYNDLHEVPKPLWLNEFVKELSRTRKECYKLVRHTILKGHRVV